ncbi:nuclear transport factor 2 family protein [Dyella lutea]|uniref:Nuclear transport factor 2 family protein n=1 Tax=Dyella lutea TaxID=2950441 RepID=A0ABT1FFF3_9GAMM|nr:nuclear transport factor 2 family protein [Dyella lutea]MCP1375860.1 nuclear transport factor 2 family protein [Dyella lutea]
MNAQLHPVSDPVARNLEVVDRHMRDEARDPDGVLALYTEDAVLEIPGRGQRFDTLEAIRDNYVRMFASMAEIEIHPMDRFATANRVVDECLVRLRITGDGLVNVPVPIGARAELRLLHVFHMRDGRIAREEVFEGWRRLDG